jgi:hypothetical protein
MPVSNVTRVRRLGFSNSMAKPLPASSACGRLFLLPLQLTSKPQNDFEVSPVDAVEI